MKKENFAVDLDDDQLEKVSGGEDEWAFDFSDHQVSVCGYCGSTDLEPIPTSYGLRSRCRSCDGVN